MTSNLNRAASGFSGRVDRSARIKRAGLSVAASLVVLALAASPALAREGLGVTGRFAQPGSGPGQLSLVPQSGPTDGSGLAVSATHDIYVADTGNNRVEWFNPAGEFQGWFNGGEVDGNVLPVAEQAPTKLSQPESIAVDDDPASPSFGDIYVAETGSQVSNGVIDKFTSTGEFLYQFSFGYIGGIAVDPSGDLWVMDHFGSGHEFNDELKNAPVGSPINLEGYDLGGLAVDSEENLYLTHESVTKFSKTTGRVLGTVCVHWCGDGGMAIEPGTNDLVTFNATNPNAISGSATNATAIGEYGPFGEPFEAPIRISRSNILNHGSAIAVDPTSHVIYVADSGGDQIVGLVAGPAPEKPEVLPPEEVKGTSAVFRGKLSNPRKEKLEYRFIYNAGSSCAGGGETETKTLSSTEAEKTEVPVAFKATKLEARAEATYCLIAENNFGPSEQAPLATPFTTPAAPPEVISESIVGVEKANETESDGFWAATVDPNHDTQETTYFFEYSAEGSVRQNTLLGTIKTVEGGGAIPAEEFGERTVRSLNRVGELQNIISYYFRVVATNVAGTTYGPVEAYTKVPIVSGGNASALAPTSATLEAEVNPDFLRTKYGFEYATKESLLGTPSASRVLSATEIRATEFEEEPASHVSLTVTDLVPYEHYYYRVIAENAATKNPSNADEGRPVFGKIGTFQTRSLALPTSGEAQNITRTRATLSGAVFAPFVPATYYYEYINQAAYLAAKAAGAGNPYAGSETTASGRLQPSEVTQAVGPVPASGLLPDTTYVYRLVAENEFGWEYGQPGTFTTTSATPPSAVTGGASGVSQNSATLSGTVTTNGLQTTYGFEIGTEPGVYSPATGLGAVGGSATEEVSVTLSELQPGTTYYYRVTATNGDGTVQGLPESFATPGFPVLLVPTASLPLIPNPSVVFPAEESASGASSTKGLTSKQKLARALKACHERFGAHPPKRRASCEAAAHRRYGTVKKKGRK